MPMYDYICNNCNKWLEAVRPMADSDKPLNCPHCGKPLERMIMPVNFWVK